MEENKSRMLQQCPFSMQGTGKTLENTMRWTPQRTEKLLIKLG